MAQVAPPMTTRPLAKPASSDSQSAATWPKTSLGEVLTDIQPGFACGAHSRGGDGVPHLRPMNVSTDGQISLADLKLVPQAAADDAGKWIKRGDVLFNNTNSPELVGKTAYYDLPEPRAFSNHMTRLRVNRERLDPRYCAVWLHQVWRDGEFAERCNNHVSQASISRDVLRELEIPLPPLAEQKRIVEAIERLTARVDATRARLANVPGILKRFRQAVLAAACSGRLTEDWREANPAVPNSVSLLRDLDGLLRTRWDAVQNQRGIGRPRKYKEPPEPTVQWLDELPESWTWASIGHLCAMDVGFAFRSKEFGEEGTRLLRGENIEPGALRWTDTAYWPDRDTAPYEHLMIKQGDIILGMDRPVISTGLKIARAKASDLPCILVQRVMRLASPHPVVTSFVHMVMQSIAFTHHLVGEQTGSDLPHVSGDTIASFAVPVPPLAEQAEIVRRVESLMKLADAIEHRVAAAHGRADKLTQSILARAFRDELVPALTEASVASPPIVRSPLWRFEDFAAVQAEIVRRFPDDATLGRKKLFKLSYLTAALANAKTDRPLRQDAAGPYDGKLQADAEAHAESQKWFIAQANARTSGDGHYRKGSAAASATVASKSLLGNQWSLFEKLMAAAAKWNSQDAELHATAHAAWNSLLAEGSEATPEAIATRFFAWSDEKVKKFTKWQVDSARRNLVNLGLVPTGRCLAIEHVGQTGLFSSSTL